MRRRMLRRLFSSAGALWAPAAFVALALAGGAARHAQAQEWARPKPVTTPPPGTATPPGRPLDADLARHPSPSPAHATPTTGARTLGELLATSTAVVQATTTGVDDRDEGRLRVYHLEVARTLRGGVDGDEALVVEMARTVAARPPLLARGASAFVLLRPAPKLSYLSEHLPAGAYLELVGDRDGIVPIGNDAERAAIEDAFRDAARVGALTDEAEARAGRRVLAFRELAGPSARLAADGVVELRHVDPLGDLAADEVHALAATLGNPAVPMASRQALVRLLAERNAKAAVPAVVGATIDSPEMLDAVLAARAALGAPAGRVELAPHLASKDPAVRAGAVRALGALGGIDELTRFAGDDPDPQVRVAAVEALGATHRAAALPALSQTFAQSDREVRQASARAILAVGGPAANDALIDLAVHGDSNETRTYAALLLLITAGRDSEPVRHMMASNPSPEVQDVVLHGLHQTHSHNLAE